MAHIWVVIDLCVLTDSLVTMAYSVLPKSTSDTRLMGMTWLVHVISYGQYITKATRVHSLLYSHISAFLSGNSALHLPLDREARTRLSGWDFVPVKGGDFTTHQQCFSLVMRSFVRSYKMAQRLGTVTNAYRYLPYAKAPSRWSSSHANPRCFLQSSTVDQTCTTC